ncbi:CDGSH iron-sulfur domain-containing protein 3, mitochondrial isoform X1 [Meles meles]|uniref:CDGSH iron-sulfur domain-containing protein 3, mitochondrial isoform X1 n=1 Tax=Meles meles TaxID=9662 RepID=UPI001E69DC31|nr:CDGSH iron-sulfur domain-containing protein 3, mitochondrial isoform X1 [Meles meles]
MGGGVGAPLRPAAWSCLHTVQKLNQRRDISSWLTRWFPKTPAKSVVAQKTPIKVELVAGKTYRWCVCGRSKKQEAPRQEVPRSWSPTLGRPQALLLPSAPCRCLLQTLPLWAAGFRLPLPSAPGAFLSAGNLTCIPSLQGPFPS